MTERIVTPQDRRIACEILPGAAPGVVFLGGFRSDMEGTKALFLRDRAVAEGRAFARFDYSGHGASEGVFEDGCIGDWFEDALAVIDRLPGPQVLVGSSMGGWIALLVARARPDKVAGLVTVAAAPDFTEDSMWAGFTEDQRAKLMQDGTLLLPSEYGDPYPITRRLIEEGRTRLVLRTPLPLQVPARFLHGTADMDVDLAVALRLLAHVDGPDIRLTLVKGADHRFSDPACLDVLRVALSEVLAEVLAACRVGAVD